MRDFANKVAAITGAGSGIGRALALELAARDCHLALCDLHEAGLAEVVNEIGGRVRVTTAIVDVANRDAVYNWAAQTVRDHGKVNLIFNNAGVSLVSSVEGVAYEDLEWIMSINFWGVVYGTKAFLPLLQSAGEGHIVNVSSIFGIFAAPGFGAYNASKFAVRGFTEALRQELELQQSGVSATCVHPGGIKTGINQTSRYSPSVKQLFGLDVVQGKKMFERTLRTSPEEAARVILRAVERNERRVLIGFDARVFDILQRLFPATYPTILSRLRKRRRRRAVA